MRTMMNSVFLAAFWTFAMAANDHIPNVEVMYSHKVNLTCMSNNIDPDANVHDLMWLLPNGDLVKKTDNHKRVMIYGNGKYITIKEVDDEDFGVYNCIIYKFNPQSYQIVQKGINLNGPYWGDLMAKYRTNLIVGGIAGAVILVLMIGICYCMNRDHSLDVDEANRVKTSDLWVSNRNGFSNAAIELDDIEAEPKKVAPSNGDTPPPLYADEEGLYTKL